MSRSTKPRRVTPHRGPIKSTRPTKSPRSATLHLVARHTLTIFNLVNLILAVLILVAGGGYRNLFFLAIAIANTLIGIINDLRAQHIVNQLRLISEQRPTIIRDGRPITVTTDAVTKGDTLVLSLGDQIPFDCVLDTGFLEVNEAFVTGEQDNIEKHPGDSLTSGSFVVSGAARATVIHSAADSFISHLQSEASHIHTADSQLFTLMNRIVKSISFALIPIGALLLWRRFATEPDPTVAVTSTVAALINMIPEGLILLTSSVLALATIRLSRAKVLVQDLYATETLARVDTICLDKTGTLTTGRLAVHDFLDATGTPIDLHHPSPSIEKSFLRPLAALLASDLPETATTSVLKQTLLRAAKNQATGDFPQITATIPFSSDRKYSGIVAGHATYLLGAIDFLTSDPVLIDEVKSLGGHYRTLALVRLQSDEAQLLGLVRLTDELRPSAKRIISYFHKNRITVKLISGDDLAAVTAVAEQAGLRELNGINLPDLTRQAPLRPADYVKLVDTYNIFTRVTPVEKQHLIEALRRQGHVVAMTGDGVNDILAMKEADVSLAIGEGADAARRVAKFVLLGSNYDAVPAIINEGRRSINNLERSTSLFLAKTVYASILAVLFVLLPFSYPYSPIEMSLLNLLCIGLPGLLLALEPNTARPKDRFKYNITHYSIPTGLAVSLAMLALSIVAHFLGLARVELLTLSFIITFIINLVLIYHISRPLSFRRLILILAILTLAVIALIVPTFRTFFLF